MDLILSFRNGVISGEGADGIGFFSINGTYSESSKECSWVKTYIGRHSVFYSGFGEGKGIWGKWNMEMAKGGFHIWPIGSQPPLDSIEAEECLAHPTEILQPVKMATQQRESSVTR